MAKEKSIQPQRPQGIPKERPDIKKGSIQSNSMPKFQNAPAPPPPSPNKK